MQQRISTLLSLGLALAGREATAQFVSTNGGHFQVDGKDFIFAGSNAYYWPFSNVADIELGMNAALDAGLTVFRTRGFNEANSTFDPSGLPKYGEGDPTTVFQKWSPDGSVEINLEPLDKVVAAAEKTGIKLIVTLTNNWADYGGMDVYTTNLGFRYHDDSDSCTTELLVEWTDEISTHVKRVDPNHLVGTGGEGAFNRESDDHFYNGGDGNDFDAELALPNIDFGVFHSYPDWWSKTVEWTNQWIRDHAAAGRTAGKPVVHEEYGWMTDKARQEQLGKTTPEGRVEVLGGRQAISIEEKMSDMFWQYGFSGYSSGRNHDDGFTIFLDDGEAQTLVRDHAKAVNDVFA
ncbi:hypothetical protein ACHAQH_004193 [Verticillium albo-atrum]